MSSAEPIFLWPNAAPLARGDALEDRPRITPFLVKSELPAPVVIVCPGGGYAVRAEHERAPIAQWLNTLGISAFVLDYRVKPYTYPAALLDVQRAIRLVRHRAKEFNIDPKRVGVLGFSAGGHLAVSAATKFDGGNPSAADPVEQQSCRPDVQVVCYAVVTFAWIGSEGHRRCMHNLLGEHPTSQQIRSVNLDEQVTPQTPPAFIWHTAEDEPVLVIHATLYATALNRNKVPFALHVFPQGRHGLGLAPDNPTVAQWKGLCAQWLKTQGF